MKDNIIKIKTFDFALKVINIYKFLSSEKKEYVLSKQLLKSGTSIGANVRESAQGQSKNDFISKLSIALKEASETEYWIELLSASDYIQKEISEDLLKDLEEIIKILTTIIKSSKINASN